MPNETEVPAVFTGQAVLEKGGKLEKHAFTPAPLGPEDIDIKVVATGLCHSDVHMRDNDWGVSKFPFVPGHEVVGVVAAKGTNVKGLEVGDRVGYGWMKDTCRCCDPCLRGEENICCKGAVGLIVAGGNGGFADYVRAPAAFAFKLPDALDSISAAPLLCAGITVYAPLRRLVHPGSKVGVLGIGGLGHLAVQFAAAMGAEVTAMSTSADKEAEAKNMGATHFVTLDQLDSLNGTLDVVLNTVSAATDFSRQLRTLKKGGALCLVGMPVTDIKVSTMELIPGQLQIMGSAVGGCRDMREMLQFAASKGIRPLVETMPLSKINEAMDLVVANKPRFRIVMVPDAA